VENLKILLTKITAKLKWEETRMKNKFYTKDGWLTPYALNCGYVHRQHDITLKSDLAPNTFILVLPKEMEEKSGIDFFDFKSFGTNGKPRGKFISGHIVYVYFGSISDCRKAYMFVLNKCGCEVKKHRGTYSGHLVIE